MKPPPGAHTLRTGSRLPPATMPAAQPLTPPAPARRRPVLRHALLAACLAWGCGADVAGAVPAPGSPAGAVQVDVAPGPSPGQGKAATDVARSPTHKAPAPTRVSLRVHRLQTWGHMALAALAGGLFAWLVMALVRLARRPRGTGAPRRQDDSRQAGATGDDVSTRSPRSE